MPRPTQIQCCPSCPTSRRRLSRWSEDCAGCSPRLLWSVEFLPAKKLLQECIHPADPFDPSVVSQRIVHVVGLDEQLVVDVPLAEQLHEPDGLGEQDVAIVVA